MHRALFAFSLVTFALAAAIYLYAAWGVAGKIRAAIAAQPYPRPYRAVVVGFETRYGRYTSTAPVVEVESPRQRKFRFTSAYYSLVQTTALRESVELVLLPGTDFQGNPVHRPEIGGAFHLWLGNLLALLALPAALAAALIWNRFVSRTRPGGYTLPS